MFKKKEVLTILLVGIVLAVSISLIETWKGFWITTIAIFLAILINVSAKKGFAYYLDSEIEIKTWSIKRYGFKPHNHFKRAFPAGIFFPIMISAFTYGSLMWLGSLVFEVKPKIYRAAKKHGLYSFSEMTEFQIGLIAIAGVVANLLLAVIGYFFGWGEFARLNIWFAFFNILPISDLDGSKIFFGDLVLWSLITSIVLIAIGYALVLI